MNNEGCEKSEKILLKDECYDVQGAIFEVYREIGSGFLEAVYQECLEKELANRQIPYQSHVELNLAYKGQALAQTYKPDFVCYDSIIVEIKAVKAMAAEHEAQLLNYLRISGMRLGFLANFGAYPKATVKRLVL
jgi:GxxExxY protein